MTKPLKGICPECEYEVDDATGVGETEGRRPEEGDLALCIRCGGPGFYEDQGEVMGLRAASPDEKVSLSNEPLVVDTQKAIRQAAAMWWDR